MTEIKNVRQLKARRYRKRPNLSPDWATGGLADDAFTKPGSQKAKPTQRQTIKTTVQTNSPSSYEVGYTKPPKKYRFAPGQSGNPNGRPLGAKNKPKVDRGALNLRDIILDQANREIAIQEGGKTKKIPAKELIIRATFASAAKGDARAQKLALYIVEAAEASKEKERRAIYEAAVDYKLAWEREVDAYHAKGLNELSCEPERPMPDPDHIYIDHVTGAVEIRGPMSRDDLPKYEWLAERKAEYIGKIQKLTSKLDQCTVNSERKAINVQLRKAKAHLDKILYLLGDWKPYGPASKNDAGRIKKKRQED